MQFLRDVQAAAVEPVAACRLCLVQAAEHPVCGPPYAGLAAVRPHAHGGARAGPPGHGCGERHDPPTAWRPEPDGASKRNTAREPAGGSPRSNPPRLWVVRRWRPRFRRLPRHTSVAPGRRQESARAPPPADAMRARGRGPNETFKAFREKCHNMRTVSGGGGGIRTHGTLARTTVFETAPFNHSGTPPLMGHQAAKYKRGRQPPTPLLCTINWSWQLVLAAQPCLHVAAQKGRLPLLSGVRSSAG